MANVSVWGRAGAGGMAGDACASEIVRSATMVIAQPFHTPGGYEAAGRMPGGGVAITTAGWV